MALRSERSGKTRVPPNEVRTILIEIESTVGLVGDFEALVAAPRKLDPFFDGAAALHSSHFYYLRAC